MPHHVRTRRQFVRGALLASPGILITCNSAAADDKAGGNGQKPQGDEGVSPAEDLMREHGVLKRVMLCYDEIVRRIEGRQDFAPKTLNDCGRIIRDFVEDYHEKLEEDYLFPRFRKAGKLEHLVDVLLSQHQAGRRVTDVILQNAAVKTDDQKRRVVQSVRAFNRMYAPHEAREDTELFPAFRGIVSAHEYDALGEDFEKKENQLFGQDGFEKMVDKVAGIEKELGIYELSQFTPRT